MRLLAILCGLAGLLGAHVAVAQPSSSPFCIVPVQGGIPTGDDWNEAWRMASDIITLPGVARPIIHNQTRRGGVWTIDDSRTFVPFGGEFPSNPLHDKIAYDPDSDRFVGVNSLLGVFALDRGETQFKKLYGVSDQSLRHPYSVQFIPRFKAFVIADETGLYLLDGAGALSPLPVSDKSVLGIPFQTFDLPAFNALVINVKDSVAVVRYDDGEVVRIASLQRFDFVTGVTVETDGAVLLRSRMKTEKIRLARPLAGPIVQGRSFAVEKTRAPMSTGRLDAPSIGKTLVMTPNSLAELSPTGRTPLALPFDPKQEPIRSITEIAEYRAVLIHTRASAYALEEQGGVTEIPGARGPSSTRLRAILAVIPVRKEAIALGENQLNLLLDRRLSGEAACGVSR